MKERGRVILSTALTLRYHFLDIVTKVKRHKNKFFIVLIVTNSLWLTYYSAPNLVFGHDWSSYLMLAQTIGPGNGSPYSTYFDIKPPALLYTIALYIGFFGTSAPSLIVFNAFVISGVFILNQKLIEKYTSLNYSIGVSLILIILIDSTNYLSSMFFNSETLGLFFCYLGLYLLLSENGMKKRISITSGILMGLAFQVKEVYFFVTLTAVLFFLIVAPPNGYTKMRTFVGYMIGVFLSQLVLLAFLFLDGGLVGYIEVLRFKGINYPFPSGDSLIMSLLDLESNLRLYYLNLAFVCGIALFSKFIARSEIFMSFSPNSRIVKICVIYVGFLSAIFIGFSWQGKPLADHYAISVIFPVVLCISAIAYVVFYELSKYLQYGAARRALCLGMLVVITFPIFQNLNVPNFLINKVTETVSLGSKDQRNNFFELISEIDSLAGPTGCIQVAYGWGTATIYNYSKREACTRFFLANLIVDANSRDEMRSDMISNPPRVILYSTGGADLDVNSFEESTFPYSQVLKSCYRDTASNNLWVAKEDSSLTSKCIKFVIKSKMA